VKRVPSATQTIVLRGESNRESREFPYEKLAISEVKIPSNSPQSERSDRQFLAQPSSNFIIFTSYGSGESSSSVIS